MSRVDEWFGGWFDRHAQRHPRPDWPRPGEKPEFYRGWSGTFKLHGVTEDVAETASVRLMADPPEFLDRHPKAVLDACRAIFQERLKAGQGGKPDTREAAALASKECGDCAGQGIATRWRQLSAGTLDAAGKPRMPWIALYCTCPLGRWIEQTHRTKEPETRRRFHDLAEHPWLNDPRYSLPPGSLQPAEAY